MNESDIGLTRYLREIGPVFMGVLYLGYRLATYLFQIAANPAFVRLGPADPLSC